MPAELEKKLRARAWELYPGTSETAKQKRNAYLYGTLRKIKEKQQHEHS